MNYMFYSSDKSFPDWRVDYFNHYWEKATSFQESKLKQ